MRKSIFLDTGYLIALLSKRDMRHNDAIAAASVYIGRFVTTDLVLTELANSLSLPSYRSSVVAAIKRIRLDTDTEVVSFTPEGMDKALELFGSRRDKSWGLTDCFSFVVMKDKHIRQALTFDNHFRQAGFETPLMM
jgi:predicted nucleic acid-binding protein